MTTKHQFLKIRFTDTDDKKKTIILHNARLTSSGIWSGTEVANDADGCGWHEVASPGYDCRVRIIDSAVVSWTTPMQEDRTYGTLVPAPVN